MLCTQQALSQVKERQAQRMELCRSNSDNSLGMGLLRCSKATKFLPVAASPLVFSYHSWQMLVLRLLWRRGQKQRQGKKDRGWVSAHLSLLPFYSPSPTWMIDNGQVTFLGQDVTLHSQQKLELKAKNKHIKIHLTRSTFILIGRTATFCKVMISVLHALHT